MIWGRSYVFNSILSEKCLEHKLQTEVHCSDTTCCGSPYEANSFLHSATVDELAISMTSGHFEWLSTTTKYIHGPA